MRASLLLFLHEARARRGGWCDNATLPSPRASPCQRYKGDGWRNFQRTLAKDAAAHPTNPNHEPRLVLIGDSITEALRGTEVGTTSPRTTGVQTALLSTLALDFASPLVLAISADETQHVLWRLRYGTELQPALAADRALIVGLLIGTNNLGNAKHSVEHTVAGVIAVARELLERTHARVLVNALLPRGKCPPTHCKPRRNYVTLIPAVDATNALVNATIRSDLRAQYHDRIAFVDCGHVFRRPPPEEVDLSLMPDALHPNVEGSIRWCQCLRRALQPWRSAIVSAKVARAATRARHALTRHPSLRLD